ncbi:hypothetical protein ES706_06370 [subsurface metagenome]
MTVKTKELLDSLCNKMYQAGYEEFRISRVRELIYELQQGGIYGIDRFTRKLSQRITDKQDYMDIFVEGRFAIILSRNGFSQISLEYSGTGPDIRANYNRQTLYFEVTRRRPKEDEWAESFDTNAVKFDSPQNIISKIHEELSQLLSGKINIIVYWSSTIRVQYSKLKDAFQQEISSNPKFYNKLSGILFTETEAINFSTLKQFYLVTNDRASRPLGIRLIRKLGDLHSKPLKELQRQRKDLFAAYRRLKDRNI